MSAGIEAVYILQIPAEISTHAQIHVHFFDTKVVVLTQDGEPPGLLWGVPTKLIVREWRFKIVTIRISI